MSLFLQCYFNLLLAIGGGALFIFIVGLFVIFRKRKTRDQSTFSPSENSSKEVKVPLTISSQDIHAIAGEDVLSTQLDLARAFIESGKTQLAKKILKHVAQFGKVAHQREAEHLLIALGKEQP